MGLADLEGVLCLLLAGDGWVGGVLTTKTTALAVAVEAEADVDVVMVVAVTVAGCVRDCPRVDAVRGDGGGGGRGHGCGRGLGRSRGRGWPWPWPWSARWPLQPGGRGQKVSSIRQS